MFESEVRETVHIFSLKSSKYLMFDLVIRIVQTIRSFDVSEHIYIIQMIE